MSRKIYIIYGILKVLILIVVNFSEWDLIVKLSF